MSVSRPRYDEVGTVLVPFIALLHTKSSFCSAEYFAVTIEEWGIFSWPDREKSLALVHALLKHYGREDLIRVLRDRMDREGLLGPFAAVPEADLKFLLYVATGSSDPPRAS